MPAVTAPPRRLRQAPPLTATRALPRPGTYVPLTVASLLLAAASLALQRAPSYDPWAWIIWGREVAHLHLVTTGGPTWKPLPVIFTTLFAPFGAAAPQLWLLVARAGGILAVALAAVLAARLVAQPRRPRLFAAAIAAVGVVTLYGYFASVAEGESEGLLAAVTLLAILRHMDGAPRQAFALAVAAALLRPESWPFALVYGIYLWRRDPGLRPWLVGSSLLVAALWFGPELWGSGSLLRGVRWAQHPRAGSPALASCPACAEVTRGAWPLLLMPLKLGLAAAVVLTAAERQRRGRSGTALVILLALGLGWIAEEAVLTQLGFSGSSRYLLAPAAVLVVVAAYGWARIAHRPALAALLVALTAALTAIAPGRGPHLGGALHEVRAQGAIRNDVQSALRRVGGPNALLACGSVQTNRSEAPLAAWTLGVPMLRTESSHGAVVIQSPGSGSPALAPARPARGGYRQVASAGVVRIFERC